MAEVDRDGRQVRLFAVEDHDEAERLTPDEAREVARQLANAAAAIDAEVRAVRALCEDEGHDWNGYDAWQMDKKIYVEWCARDLCEARRESAGWREEGPTDGQ